MQPIATNIMGRHDIKTLSTLLAHWEGNPSVTGEFLSQKVPNAEL